MNEQTTPEGPHKRRVRYGGTHPRSFTEKYKELNPEKYRDDVEKVMSRGQTPAGMHRSICMNEILELLHPAPGECGLDATLGYGGHSRELLARVQPGGRLFCTDVDPLELPRTEARLRALGYPDESLIVRKSNFAGILKILPETNGGFNFILADLGLSSMQIDNPERGFTFKAEGPLDLRLNPERGQPASTYIAAATEIALVKILREHSDEVHAEPIAAAIYKNRTLLTTTTKLADAIRAGLARVPFEDREAETTKAIQRTFQAIRIAVNDEFSALEQFLRALPTALAPNGRVAILTFHSGEDKRVGAAFRDGLANGSYSSIATDPIRPSSKERYDNPRSKCARLRWAIRAET